MPYSIQNKTVLITGASSGIGKACAYQFAQQQCRLILAARREDRLQALAAELKDQYNIEIFIMPLDVQHKTQVQTSFAQLPANWRDIDILVNNAGLALGSDKLQDGLVENWETMIDTNIKGFLYVIHEVLKNMVRRNSGHIINIGSVAGHDYYPGGNVYCATKHAVKAISKTLRMDILGSAIRVTEIAPGAVHTEFSEVRWQDKQRALDFYSDFAPLTADDIADNIVYAATRPPHVNIAEILVMPTAQASANFLHRGDKGAKSMLEK